MVKVMNKKSIFLYHGSNIPVKYPKILNTKTKHDFGRAFYTTTNYEQACSWAKHKVRISGYVGKPVVSVFSFDISSLSKLRILKFDSPTKIWLEYIMNNRLNPRYEGISKYDLVIGPLIDGYLSWDTLKMYSNNLITFEEAIDRLHPENLDDQWAFKSQISLSCLQYRRTL